MDYINVPNYRAIKVKYVSPTNTRGSRIKLTDDYITDLKQSITIAYDYAVGNVLQQAINVLESKGFNIVGRADTEKEYLILVDNWGEDFKTLKDS